MDGVLLADSVEVKAVGIRGNPVRLTPAIIFERGTAADIAVNVPGEIEGFFAVDGVLVATEVVFLQ